METCTNSFKFVSGGINKHFRKLSSHHRESIVEDVPFVINVSKTPKNTEHSFF